MVKTCFEMVLTISPSILVRFGRSWARLKRHRFRGSDPCYSLCTFRSLWASYWASDMIYIPLHRRAAKYIPLTNGETRLQSENTDISGLDEWLLNLFGKLQNQSSA
jgi:hypothetical protein